MVVEQNSSIGKSEKISWPGGFRGFFFFALLLVCFFSYEMGNRPFASPDEGRYVEIPREMIATGDYITPKLDGLNYFEKPPLLYWMQAAVAKFCGINEYSMRAIIVIFAILGCLGVFLIGRKRFSDTVGLFSGSILATNLLYYAHSHIIILDLVTSVFMCGTLWCFYTVFVQQKFIPKRSLIIWMYVLAALTCLTKGLIGIILPGFVVFLWILFTNSWKKIPQMLSLPGIILFLLIAVPWHVVMSIRHEDFLYKYFYVEHFLRYTTTYHARYQPAYFFIPIVIAGLFPWTGFAFVALEDAVMNAIKKNSEAIFFLCWILGIFAFYSFSDSKLIPYILPIVPPIALLTGACLDSSLNLVNEKKFRLSVIISLLLSLCFVGAFLVYKNQLQDLLADKELLLAIYVIVGLMIANMVVLIFAYFVRESRLPAILVFLFIGMNIMWVINKGAACYQDIKKPSTKKMAELIRLNKRADDLVYCYDYYYQDFPVYMQETVGIVNYIGELEFGLHSDGGNKSRIRFLSTDAFWKMWTTTKKRIFLLLSTDSYRDVFVKRKEKHRLLGIDKHFVVIMNR